MAVKGLPNFVWIKPGNKYGVEVTTRTAYNPLTGEMLNVRQAQTRQHGGVSYEQRKRAEKGEMLKEKVKYTVQDKLRFLNTANKDLTPYQRSLKREWSKPRSASDLANLTGMGRIEAQRRISGSKGAVIDESSLRFQKGNGVVIRTTSGSEKFLVKIEQKGKTPKYAFYSERSFSNLISGIGHDEHYPSLDEPINISKVYADGVEYDVA